MREIVAPGYTELFVALSTKKSPERVVGSQVVDEADVFEIQATIRTCIGNGEIEHASDDVMARTLSSQDNDTVYRCVPYPSTPNFLAPHPSSGLISPEIPACSLLHSDAGQSDPR